MNALHEPMTLARERFAARDYHGVVFVLRGAAAGGTLFADGWNLLGLALALLGRPAEALDALGEALRTNPHYIEALLNRALVLNELGRPGEGQDDLRRAAEMDAPDATGFPAMVANRLANSHAALGDEYRAAGALERAVEQYRRALELRPGFADIRLALGRALLERGEHAAAGAELEVVQRSHPEWLDAMLLRGLAAYLQGELHAAQDIWDAAAARHPDEPRLEIYRSMLTRRLAGRQ